MRPERSAASAFGVTPKQNKATHTHRVHIFGPQSCLALKSSIDGTWSKRMPRALNLS
jgi:hypothetical protein